MKRLLLLFISGLLTISAAGAEGKLCATIPPADDNLCVVNDEAGPRWYMITACEDLVIVEPPDTGIRVEDLAAAPGGRFVAVLSADGERFRIGIFRTGNLDHGGKPEQVAEFAVGGSKPGLDGWRGTSLDFSADASLDSSISGGQTGPARFSYNVETGVLGRHD